MNVLFLHGLDNGNKPGVKYIFHRTGDSLSKASTYTLPGIGYAVSFSPDGQYIAVGHGSSPYFTLLKRIGDSVSLASTYVLPQLGQGVSFSPDGQYIAASHFGAPYFTLLKRTGDSISPVSTYTLPGNGGGVSFSPDGQYIAVCSYYSTYFTLLKRTGDSVSLASTYTLPGNGGGVSFSPDGQYIAVGHDSSPYFTLLKRTGDSVSLASIYTLSGFVSGVSFSPDGQYIAVAHNGSPYFTLLKRIGDSVSLASTYTIPGIGRSVSFSPDGQYIAVGHDSSPYFTLLKRTGDSVSLASTYNLLGSGYGVSFSSDCQYIAVAYSGSVYFTLLRLPGYLETTEAQESNILAADIFSSGFVIIGMDSSKDATILNQLNVNPGSCYVKQTDGTLRRFELTKSIFITSEVSSTYYLDFQPDGTYSWGTAHSTQSNYLPIAEITTDSSGNISTVTDKRILVPGIGKVNASFLEGKRSSDFILKTGDTMTGNLTVPQINTPSIFHSYDITIDTDGNDLFLNCATAFINNDLIWHAGNSHKSSHSIGGTDALTPADIGAVNKAGDTMTGKLRLTSGASALSLEPGSVDHCYLEFYADSGAPTTRSGWIGYGGVGTSTLSIVNRMAGPINLVPATGYPVQVSGNTIWHAGNADVHRTATFVVAASNSSAVGKAIADYVCDGGSDQIEINAALSALGSTGGRVLLLEGTFIVDGPINVPSNATLAGQGWGTVIKIKDALNADVKVVQNADQTNGNTNIVLRDFAIDGNKVNNTAGIQQGLYLYRTTYSLIVRLLVTNCRSYGIYLDSSSNNTVTGNTCQGNNSYGIYLGSYSSNNTVIGNTCQGNNSYGIYLGSYSSNNTVTGNTCQGNDNGICLGFSSNNTVTGNTCQGNNSYGIRLYNSSNNTVTGNTCQGNNSYGIYLGPSCSNSTVTGNTCQGNNKDGIRLYNSSNNTVTGNTCLENSQAAHNTYSNIYVVADSNYNNIQANICRRGALASKPRCGICIDSADCDGNLVTNNDLYTGGATAAFSDAGTGTVTTAGNRTA